MRELSRELTLWLHNNGLDPLVVFGIVGLGIIYLQKKDLKNWKNLPPYMRRFVIAQIVGSGVLVVGGLLSAFGILNLMG